jgi:hypothetical protein
MKKVWFAVSIVLFLRCGNSSSSDSISDFETTFSMVGEEVLDDELDAILLYSVDSLLIIKKRGKLGIFFSVYNSPEMVKIGDFGSVGEGPNEFMAARITGCTIQKDNSVLLPINDPARNKVQYLDFSHFIATGNEDYHEAIDIDYNIGLTQGIFYLSDTVLVSIPGIDRIDFGRLLFYNISNDSSYINELFPVVLDQKLTPQDKYALYFSHLTVNQDQRIIASAMDAFDRIDLFDFSGMLIQSIITGDSDRIVKTRDIKDDNGLIPYNTQYMDIKSTVKYIFALYFNQDYRKLNKEKIEPKLRIFTWDGKPISELIFEDYIMSFAIDIKSGVLYGIDNYSNKIFKYDLSDVLPIL